MERLTLHFVPSAQEARSVLDEVEDLVKRWCFPLSRHHVTQRPDRPQIARRSTGTHTAAPNLHFVQCDRVAGSTISGDRERRVTEGGDLLVLVRGDGRSSLMTTSPPVLKCPCEVPASVTRREPTSSTGCQTLEAVSGVFRNPLGRSVGQSSVRASEVASSGTGRGRAGVRRLI